MVGLQKLMEIPIGKRSAFDRKPRDFYKTPDKAVLPLLPHLAPRTRFYESCCGDGALIRALERRGHICKGASDIQAPEEPAIVAGHPVAFSGHIQDATTLRLPSGMVDCFITNPPFRKDILFPLIAHLSAQAPTWLLLPADFLHNIGSSPFLDYCVRIVSIGRVSWEENGVAGKDNHIWALFDQERCGEPTEFYGRLKKGY